MAAASSEVTTWGARLFGLPSIHEHSSSPVPERWRTVFIEQADRQTRKGLFTSCRSGRDLLLTSAKRASLTLDTTRGHPYSQWVACLSAAKQLLARRPQHSRTDLALYADSFSYSASICSLILSELQGPNITRLVIIAFSHIDSSTLTLLLHQAAAAFPQLDAIELVSCACPLPPPSVFPKLTDISIALAPSYDRPDSDGKVHLPPAELLTSVSQYLHQLTDIDIVRHEGFERSPTQQPPLSFPWHHLLTPQTTTHTLTVFSTSDPLTDELLGLLLQSAPALETLSVSRLQLGSDHRGEQWVLKDLNVPGEEADPAETMQCLSRLPSRDAGRLHVELGCPVVLTVTSAEGLDPVMAAQLSRFEFGTHTIDLCPADGLLQTDDVAELRAALVQLRELRAPFGIVELDDWEWNEQTAQVLAELLPTVPHPDIGVNVNEPLTDAMLARVFFMGPRVQFLSVDSLALQLDTHANTPWPWKRVCVYGKEPHDMTMLLRLPHPATHTGVRPPLLTMFCAWNMQVKQADAARLTEWLSHVQWSGEPTFTLPHPPRNLPLLSIQLSVLRAVRLWDRTTTTDTQQDVTVQLSKWPLRANNMALLQGLPAWCGALDLCTCTWPLKPAQYTQLASHVPTTYTRWLLGARLSDARINAICDGVNQRRAGLGLQPLRLVVPSHEGRDRRVGEHVIVSSRAEGGSDGADSSGGGSDESEGYSSDMMGEGELVPMVGDEEWSE